MKILLILTALISTPLLADSLYLYGLEPKPGVPFIVPGSVMTGIVSPDPRTASAVMMTPELAKDVFKGCDSVRQLCEIPTSLTGGDLTAGNLTHTINP